MLGAHAEIRTLHFADTIVESYRYANLLGDVTNSRLYGVEW
jgi:hypothetical protein